MRILLTRPRDRAEPLARRLEAQGHEVLIGPLLTIEPVDAGCISLDGVQAVLLTSANAVPALPPDGRKLPVLAVGKTTAEAARATGCRPVLEAEGDASSLARMVRERYTPAAGALLHLCGAQVREGLAEPLVAAGFEVRRRVVYRARAASALSAEVISALDRGGVDAVLLLSPRTACIFVELVSRHGLEARLTAVEAHCLSAAVAEPCRAPPFAAVRIAARPELGALLERLEAPAGRW